MIKNITDSIIISFKYHWKVFLLSLAIQLLITSLLRLGFHTPKMFDALLLSNFTSQVQNLTTPEYSKADIFDSVRPQLEQKENTPAPVPASSENTALPAEYGQASAYVVIDLDNGEVLLEKNGDKKLPVASLTKIMTAVVALDLASPEEVFTASYKAANIIPTKIAVSVGAEMTLGELLPPLLMASANDSAQMVKEGVDRKYGEEIFIRAMNAKAVVLGLKDTRFANAQGFDSPNNFSSAEDLAILSQYALANYPQITEIVKDDYQFLPATSGHPQANLYNWNGLLGVYPGVYGKAGYTTVVASKRDGHRLLVVVLGAPGVLERDIWASQALDAGFAKYGLDPVGVTPLELQVKYASWK